MSKADRASRRCCGYQWDDSAKRCADCQRPFVMHLPYREATAADAPPGDANAAEYAYGWADGYNAARRALGVDEPATS